MSPLNSYFLQGSPGEQRLIQDLVNEQLKMYGEDVLYLPRKIIGENTVIRENTVAKFDDSFRIEAYLMNYEGFAGASADLLTKFGVRNTDELTLVISKERYDDFCQPIIDLFPKEERKNAKRPQEGDLIYFPLEESLFEIKFVEGKKPFYQLRNLYVYELLCERFEFEDEIFDVQQAEDIDGRSDTNVSEAVSSYGNVHVLNLAATNATEAVGSISGPISVDTARKSVQFIDLIHDGSGYKLAPKVIIEKPHLGVGTPLELTSTVGSGGSISSLQIVNSGSQYFSSPPTITVPKPEVRPQYSLDKKSTYHLKLEAETFDLNIETNQLQNTIKFGYFYTGSTLASNQYLFQSNDVRVKWVSANTVTVEVRQISTNSFVEPAPISNRTVTLGTGWNDIEVFFDGESFELYVTVLSTNIRTLQFAEGIDEVFANNAEGDIGFRSLTFGDDALGLQYYDNPRVLDGNGTEVWSYDFNTFQQAEIVATTNNNGEVTSVSVSNPGAGYTSPPILSISDPLSGTRATAVAIMTSRSANQDLSIDRVLIINPGYGYTQIPSIRFEGGDGSGAIATCTINSGVLSPVAISSGGVGYSTTPQVFIQPVFVADSVGVSSEINNAKGEVVLNVNNEVTEIRYANAGAGYSFSPTVNFTSPTSDTFGDYTYNEIVTGQRSGTTGYVRKWDSDDRILHLATVSGTFQRGEAIVGAGASYKLSTVESNEFLDEFADNEDIESEADAIIDFSQQNPFGEF